MDSKKTSGVSVKVSEALNRQLKIISKKTGISIRYMMDQAIKEYLKRYEVLLKKLEEEEGWKELNEILNKEK